MVDGVVEVFSSMKKNNSDYKEQSKSINWLKLFSLWWLPHMNSGKNLMGYLALLERNKVRRM